MNWSIDVPVLLTQLLIVGGITGLAFQRRWAAFVVAGEKPRAVDAPVVAEEKGVPTHHPQCASVTPLP